MNCYDYQKTLKRIREDARAKYESGNREPDSYFNVEELAELASIGLDTITGW